MATIESIPVRLKLHQRASSIVLAILLRIWGRTLRFHWGADVKALLDGDLPPSVVIFWHNRLFAAPIFYCRYYRSRRISALISASKDGAWLSEFVKKLGIYPVYGSRNKRGSQAMRDLISLQRKGYDVAVTPDGSRGPLYKIKAGAVGIAIKTGSPILLLSFNYNSAWRLKSWDKFYLPYPFSRVEVRMDYLTNGLDSNISFEQATSFLKLRLKSITRD